MLCLTATAQNVRTSRTSNTTSISSSTNTASTSSNSNPYNIQQTDTSAAADTTFKGIDYDHVDETDSAMLSAIFMFHAPQHCNKIFSAEHPNMNPTGLEFFDPLDSFNGDYFVSTGGWGHPHQSLLGNVTSSSSSTDWMWPNVNSLYFTQPKTATLYQTRRPYTVLGYGGSLNQDNKLQVTHTQNVAPRWNIAVDYNLIHRAGIYTRSAVDNRQLCVTTNYYSSDARYQVQAGVIRQNFTVQENGGISNDSIFINNEENNRAGIPVNLYNAANQWRTFNVFVHQSYNTVRQVDNVRPRTIKISHDTIVGTDTLQILRDSVVGMDTLRIGKPHMFNTGVIGIDVNFGKWKRNYHDSSPSANYYNHFYYDSTATYTLSADLYWTNDAYLDYLWHNPLKITAGVTPQLKKVTSIANLETQWGSLAPFTHLELGSLVIDARYTLSNSHEGGDAHIEGVFSLPLKKDHSNSISISAIAQQQSPQWLFYQYYANNYQWNNTNLGKTATQRVSVCYKQQQFHDTLQYKRIFNGVFSIDLSHISNNIWLNESLQPYQTDADAYLLQAQLQGQFTLGWFHYDMQHIVQHTTNNNVVRVPLFATKNSFYGDFTILKALRIQTGFDIRYHTKYYADAYCPALGAFYRQNEIEIGNYLWADFFVTLKVKQANIYAKVVHLNAPLEQTRHDFLLPHYPGEDLGIYWGIVWKFFN